MCSTSKAPSWPSSGGMVPARITRAVGMGSFRNLARIQIPTCLEDHDVTLLLMSCSVESTKTPASPYRGMCHSRWSLDALTGFSRGGDGCDPSTTRGRETRMSYTHRHSRTTWPPLRKKTPAFRGNVHGEARHVQNAYNVQLTV